MDKNIYGSDIGLHSHSVHTNNDLHDWVMRVSVADG